MNGKKIDTGEKALIIWVAMLVRLFFGGFLLMVLWGAIAGWFALPTLSYWQSLVVGLTLQTAGSFWGGYNDSP